MLPEPLAHCPDAYPGCMFACSSITLGRVAWICPEGIAPHLGHFVGPWCAALRHIRDDIEKGHAFLGLCRLLRLNPQVCDCRPVLQLLLRCTVCIALWSRNCYMSLSTHWQASGLLKWSCNDSAVANADVSRLPKLLCWRVSPCSNLL